MFAICLLIAVVALLAFAVGAALPDPRSRWATAVGGILTVVLWLVVLTTGLPPQV